MSRNPLIFFAVVMILIGVLFASGCSHSFNPVNPMSGNNLASSPAH